MRISTFMTAAAASVAVLALAGAASAQAGWTYHKLGTESFGGGFTGGVPSNGTISVASDGELTFRPFGITHDVSDAVSLSSGNFGGANIWQAAAGNNWENFGGGVWDIPACIPGGACENQNIFEQVGMWIAPGFKWVNGNNAYIISEAGGRGSDLVRTFNVNGVAAFTMDSNWVPEPATWAMMILGLGLVGVVARRRASAVAA